MSLRTDIKTALTPIVPTAYLSYDGKITTYITYFEYNSQGEDWAENEEIATAHYWQIDLWTKAKDDVDLYKPQIKTALKNIGFSGFTTQDIYESDTKTFHVAIRCNFIDSTI